LGRLLSSDLLIVQIFLYNIRMLADNKRQIFFRFK
jgi:hypothetical protein